MNPKQSLSQAHRSVYIRVVLYSLISSITAYIHSSYLISAGLTQPQIDSIYIMLSVCGIIGVWLLAVQRRSIASFARILLGLAAMLVLSLSLINSSLDPRILIPAVFLFLGLESPMFFIFDELLEHVTSDASTSQTRSTYLVLQNTAWIIAPLIGFILIDKSSSIAVAYQMGLILSIILTAYSLYSLRHTKKEQIKTSVANKPFNAHILPAIYSHFALYLFYACMISIMPVYMNTVLNWSWSRIGGVIALALLAFPIVQIPLGKILHKHHIEKVLMPIAMIIISLSIIAFIFTKNSTYIALPIISFFFTRVGAAILEVCNESYIFRHIDYTHRTTIALFRSLSPLSYLFVPLYWLVISLSHAESLIMMVALFLAFSSLFVIVLFDFRNLLKSN